MIEVSFPSAGLIKAQVGKTGYVARALLMEGRRREALPVEEYSGRKVEPQDFGYIAGTATHVTSGLEHCILLALFDPEARLGAAGHFQVFSEADTLPSAVDSLNEFIANTQDMKTTLTLIGSTLKKLQGFCVFGMSGIGAIAPVVDILQVLNNQGIPVPQVAICQEPEHVFQSYLERGVVNYYFDGQKKTHKIFEASPNPTDQASRILHYGEEVIAYFDEICGEFGRKEFFGHALPYLAAKHFSDPEKFFNQATQAVDEGSERPARAIGDFFRGLVRA
jgi:hypothetical protein